jgi:hypothetical protein
MFLHSKAFRLMKKVNLEEMLQIDLMIHSLQIDVEQQ